MTGALKASASDTIRTLIARSGRYLDAGQFDHYVALYGGDGRYSLEAASSEIGQEMIWLRLSRDELQALLKESPQHVHDIATRTHLIAVDEININGDRAKVCSTFSVFRTDKTGMSQVYAVGRYDDTLRIEAGEWRIADRRAVTTTRMFRTPTPMPL